MAHPAEVRWNKDELVLFQGRNGTGLCCGLWLTTATEKVVLRPITSTGRRANCYNCVPLAALPRLIAALRKRLPAAPPRRGA
jgi:hypothetical protein